MANGAFGKTGLESGFGRHGSWIGVVCFVVALRGADFYTLSSSMPHTIKRTFFSSQSEAESTFDQSSFQSLNHF